MDCKKGPFPGGDSFRFSCCGMCCLPLPPSKGVDRIWNWNTPYSQRCISTSNEVNYIELLISINICRSLCRPSTFSGGGGSTITRVEGCWGLSGMTPLRRWWKAIGSILAGRDADTLKTTVFLLSDLESDNLPRKRSSNCWGGEK